MIEESESRRLQDPEKALQRIEVLVHDPLFERDDGVLGDGDALRANLAAARCDVAVADALRLFQFFDAIFHIDETTALEPLERSENWEAGEEVPETYPFTV